MNPPQTLTPGAYTLSYPFLARTPPSQPQPQPQPQPQLQPQPQPQTTTRRRDSIASMASVDSTASFDSFDSITQAKHDQNALPGGQKPGIKSAVAHALRVMTGRHGKGGVRSHDTRQAGVTHEGSQAGREVSGVYVLGDQAVFFQRR